MRILLIIPAYNEEKNILNTVKQITDFDEKLDYIVINDGSTDNTENILKENNINHINLIQNLGIGGAVQTGYKYAYENNYDIAVQFDGDGQHDIKYLKNICDPIETSQVDMCIGSRYLDNATSSFKSTFMRRVGKNIISFTLKICIRKKVSDPTSGFRAVNKKLIKIFAKEYSTEYPEPESIVTASILNKNVIEVPVNMKERTEGKSSIRLLKTIDYMIKVILTVVLDSINLRRRKK